MKKFTIIVLIIAVVLGIWYYVSKNKANETSETNQTNTTSNVAPAENTTQNTTPANPSTSAAPQDNTVSASVSVKSSPVKQFTVTGANYSFTPSTLSVKKGDTVKLTFKNSNGMHDLRIDEFGVATSRIASGTQETVTFIADKVGSFQYYCSVGSHRAMGMWGTLTVTQ